MRYVIDHERYGVRTEFGTLAEALQTIRDCGPEFADTTLTIRGDEIVDDRGDVVGTILTDDEVETSRP